MTIVSGFSFADGLLFCADSEHTGYGHKVHEPKLFGSQGDYGSVIFGFAGNPSFARTTIYECQQKLANASSSSDPRAILKRTIDQEYRRLILTVPIYAGDSSYHFRLLIGLRSNDGGLTMYSTEGPALCPCSQHFCCLGVGESLGLYLMQSLFTDNMPIDRLLVAATYMMARVKSFVPGCGGATQLLVLSRDGSQSDVGHWDTPQVENRFHEFDERVAQVLFAIGDPTISNEDFSQRIMDFSDYLLAQKNESAEANIVLLYLVKLAKGLGKTPEGRLTYNRTISSNPQT